MSLFDGRDRPLPAADPAAQRRYATSGKIMLSAIVVLFAVVVIMLCLHVYARFYFLRRRRRLRNRQGRRTHFFFYVDPAAAPATTQNSGLDPVVLKALPTFTFSEVGGAGDEGFVECAVCLSEFEDGEKGRQLPKCGHSFHVDCIDMWFHSHSTCPLCRTAVDGGLDALEKGGEDTQAVNSGESTRPSSGDSNQLNTRTVAESGGEFRPGPSSSASFKSGMVEVSVEVPARSASFSFGSSDGLGPSSPASQGFRSPTSRLLALRRMLSRERKPASPSSARAGAVGYELAEVEEGRVETRTSQEPSCGGAEASS